MKKIYALLLFLFIELHSYSQVPAFHFTQFVPGSAGYYFVDPFTITGQQNTLMIIDSAGNLVYYKPTPSAFTLDFKLHSNGLMSYGNNGANSKFYLMDSTFTIVDSVSCKNGVLTDTHDLLILANGHYLMIGLENVTMDLSSYPYFYHNGTFGSATATVLCLVVQELDANKNVVFEWHAKDYFAFDSVDDFWLNDPNTVDWTHSNAIELDDDGNILVSSRHLNEITKINRSDSTIMWRFGGKYNQFTFIGDTLPFYGQHDIRRISNGHVTLYDNGIHNPSHYARALEYELDEVNMTAEKKWSYVYDTIMSSYATGSVQRLQNGNTLINYGVITNNKNVHFNLVDSIGNSIFELAFDDSLYGYRTFNFEMPWGLNRPQVTCFDSAGSKFLDAGSGFSSYEWNDGSTSQVIQVTSLDTFFVFVPYGQGGFISSERLIVADTSSLCNPTALPELEQESQFQMYPNPAYDELTLVNPLGALVISDISLFDASGRLVTHRVSGKNSGWHTVSLNISKLVEGVYFIRVNNRTMKFVKMF